jgi:hypothetical protein
MAVEPDHRPVAQPAAAHGGYPDHGAGRHAGDRIEIRDPASRQASLQPGRLRYRLRPARDPRGLGVARPMGRLDLGRGADLPARRRGADPCPAAGHGGGLPCGAFRPAAGSRCLAGRPDCDPAAPDDDRLAADIRIFHDHRPQNDAGQPARPDPVRGPGCRAVPLAGLLRSSPPGALFRPDGDVAARPGHRPYPAGGAVRMAPIARPGEERRLRPDPGGGAGDRAPARLRLLRLLRRADRRQAVEQSVDGGAGPGRDRDRHHHGQRLSGRPQGFRPGDPYADGGEAERHPCRRPGWSNTPTAIRA